MRKEESKREEISSKAKANLLSAGHKGWEADIGWECEIRRWVGRTNCFSLPPPLGERRERGGGSSKNGRENEPSPNGSKRRSKTEQSCIKFDTALQRYVCMGKHSSDC